MRIVDWREHYIIERETRETLADRFHNNPTKENEIAIIDFIKKEPLFISYISKKMQTQGMVDTYLQYAKKYQPKLLSTRLLDQHRWNLITQKLPFEISKVPPKYITEEMCINAICYSKHYTYYIPKDFDKNKIIKEAQKRIKERKSQTPSHDLAICQKNITHKYYNAENNEFIVIEDSPYHRNIFKSFDEFYEYVNHDLSYADLRGYGFKGVDLSKYCIKNCYISRDILISKNLYNDILRKSILDKIDYDESLNTDSSEIILIDNLNHQLICENDISTTSPKDILNVGYISDIHLEHTLTNKYNECSREDLEIFLKETYFDWRHSRYHFILNAGDVASSKELNTLFYSHFTKGIISILGNHELWDSSLYKNNPVEDVIAFYREIATKNNCILLQNDLLFIGEDKNTVLSEDEVFSLADNTIIEYAQNSKMVILGGIGFTGYCNDKNKNGIIYNAEAGLYRNALTSLAGDILYTQKFEKLYHRVKEILGTQQIIILTHTPKECWSKDSYNPNWIYVNGHTHRNCYKICENKVLFADNQIGYHKTTLHLHGFETKINIKDTAILSYPDGIHKINYHQYRQFLNLKDILCQYNDRISPIYMLKKNNKYMFIKETSRNFVLLEGGHTHTLEHDFDYYYNNMDYYGSNIMSIFSNYWDTLDKIASFIKKIHGAGTIHGCIIDIDYNNHIYVNPYDGKLTYYYADSMSEKYIYPSLQELLTDQSIQKAQKIEEYIISLKNTNKTQDIIPIQNNYQIMLNEYKKLLTPNEKNFLTHPKQIKPIFVSDTSMYKASRAIKTLQYYKDNDVIRKWYDGILSYNPSIGPIKFYDLFDNEDFYLE